MNLKNKMICIFNINMRSTEPQNIQRNEHFDVCKGVQIINFTKKTYKNINLLKKIPSHF